MSTQSQQNNNPLAPATKPGRRTLGIVIAVIVVVVVVLAVALWFAILPSPPGGGNSQRPSITFTPVTTGGPPVYNGTADWGVATTSAPAKPFSSYKVSIEKDGSPLVANPQILSLDIEMSFGASVRLWVLDAPAIGKLTTGDSFHVYGMQGTHRWNFSLIWGEDDHVLQRISWHTEVMKPLVAFGAYQSGGLAPNITESWIVVATTAGYPFSYYEVEIIRDGVPLGMKQTLSADTVIVLGGTVRLILNDFTDDGNLTVADTFYVYGMDAGRSWTFNLIWEPDVSIVDSAQWST